MPLTSTIWGAFLFLASQTPDTFPKWRNIKFNPWDPQIHWACLLTLKPQGRFIFSLWEHLFSGKERSSRAPSCTYLADQVEPSRSPPTFLFTFLPIPIWAHHFPHGGKLLSTTRKQKYTFLTWDSTFFSNLVISRELIQSWNFSPM